MILTNEAEARAWVAALPGANAAAMARLESLSALLAEENGHQNLVSAASLDQVWLRHIADSAQLLALAPEPTPGPWLDLGTGAGFPGLAIAALRPRLDVILVESRARRVEWLERAARELGLDKVRVVGTRLERLATFPAAVISARAFAPLDRLLDLSARFSTRDTLWLLPKGRSARDEVEQLKDWKHLFHVEQSLTDPEAGIIVGSVKSHSAGRKARRA